MDLQNNRWQELMPFEIGNYSFVFLKNWIAGIFKIRPSPTKYPRTTELVQRYCRRGNHYMEKHISDIQVKVQLSLNIISFVSDP